MIRIQEAIAVEGRYDKNTLQQLVSTTIFDVGGFQIMKDREMLHLLRQTAEKRGLILLMDSDGAGFVIRNRLKSLLPAQGVLHAYIPQIPGKEKRKRVPGKEGLLGVEGMTPEILLKALQNCGAHFLEQDSAPTFRSITRQDLYALGLMGGPDSSRKRQLVKAYYGLPSHLGTSGFLQALELISSRQELEALLDDSTTLEEHLQEADP